VFAATPATASPLDRPIDGSSTAVVVAHPDDEAIAFGALLSKLPGVHVVLVSDGAPADCADAFRYGFAHAASYAACRQAEMEAALAVAGIAPSALVRLGIPDQDTARNLASAASRLAALFAEWQVATVLTHAYEGGHPDHDAVAFCVHAACVLSRRPPAVVEAPLYHLGGEGWVLQRFCDGRDEVVDPLGEEERERKARMFACHASQASVLRPFSCAVERYRRAPAYDFSRPANGGRTLYARQDWGLDPAEWPSLVRAASRDLGLPVAS
jgi:LmbE family N-acetylglucosaminyl deacetylase